MLEFLVGFGIILGIVVGVAYIVIALVALLEPDHFGLERRWLILILIPLIVLLLLVFGNLMYHVGAEILHPKQ